MFPSHLADTSHPSTSSPYRAGSSPELRYVTTPVRSPRQKVESPSSTSCKSVRSKRKEQRSCSDGPLTSPLRFMAYSPGSPCRSRKESLTSMSEEYQQKLDFRKRGNTMPSRTYLPGWPSSSSVSYQTPNEECYRLRSFSVTSKGIVHLGDLFRHRSKSVVSLGSDGSSSTTERDSFRDRENSTGGSTLCSYRVAVLGNRSAGKSTLVSQFMTSENLVHFDDDIEEERNQENTVSVLLHGEESEISFVDPIEGNGEIDVDIFNSMDAIMVVYSISDRESFSSAAKMLEHLYWLNRNQSYNTSWSRPLKAIILVGNKADLARCRVVPTEEAKNLANKFNSKFIETSGAIGHNVNELLVGILNQIRLHARYASAMGAERSSFKGSTLTNKARGLVHRLMMKCDYSKARSCDNLNVL